MDCGLLPIGPCKESRYRHARYTAVDLSLLAHSSLSNPSGEPIKSQHAHERLVVTSLARWQNPWRRLPPGNAMHAASRIAAPRSGCAPTACRRPKTTMFEASTPHKTWYSVASINGTASLMWECVLFPGGLIRVGSQDEPARDGGRTADSQTSKALLPLCCWALKTINSSEYLVKSLDSRSREQGGLSASETAPTYIQRGRICSQPQTADHTTEPGQPHLELS